MINRDSLSLGILWGALLPLGFTAGFYLFFYLLTLIPGLEPFMTLNSLILLGIAPNFLFVRYYFNKKHWIETGKGFIFISVGYVMMFFLFIHRARLFDLPGLVWQP